MRAWGLPAAAIVVTFAAVTVAAQTPTARYSGNDDFHVYCSSCHGGEARGDGMIAKSLKKRPADLTQLSRRNGGVFPDDKVFKIIDGRKGGAHTDSDMPAWGEVFAKASESASDETAAERIEILVRYLETLQAK